MNVHELSSLQDLCVVGELREHRAAVQSERARGQVRACELACQRREAAADALVQAGDQARLAQFEALQAGMPMPGLQQFIGVAKQRWQREQQALGEDRQRLQDQLARARRDAYVAAAAAERAAVYATMLSDAQTERQALLDDQDEE